MLKAIIANIFCCLIFFAACKKESNIPQEGKLTPVADLPGIKGAGVATPLTGKWRWLGSFHTSSGYSNPASAGYAERIEFGTDSTMLIYRDNVFYYGFYYTYKKNYTYKNTVFDVTLINGYTYKTDLKNDTLKLSTFDLIDENYMTYVKLP